jgi:hypothetical protein
VRPHPALQPVIHRPDIQIDGLDATERPLHPGQGLVAEHRIGIAERRLGQAGAHDIKPVGSRLGGDLGCFAGIAESVVGDRQTEMLFHLVGVEHFADGECDLGGATQRIAFALDPGLDGSEILLGGRQQFFTLAGAFGGEIGIAADHQPLAGKVR